MIRQDFILDNDRNPVCENGDFVTGDSDAQNVDLLLVSAKGSFKENPIVGAGLLSFLKKPDTSIKAMRREITVQLQNDGYKTINFEVDENGEYILDYENNY